MFGLDAFFSFLFSFEIYDDHMEWWEREENEVRGNDGFENLCTYKKVSSSVGFWAFLTNMSVAKCKTPSWSSWWGKP